MCPRCHHRGGSLLHCLSTLTSLLAVYFCCTVPGVASAGRYPVSCPVKPGLSSPDPFRLCQPRLHILLTRLFYHVFCALATAYLHVKAASSDKFPQNRVVRNIFARNCKEIVQKFKQTLCLVIFRLIFCDLEEQWLSIHL